ncbi:MAG: cyclase family protein [Burkholderiales bacterium]|nr:cyclase family protein [Burkholderiales bacterium]
MKSVAAAVLFASSIAVSHAQEASWQPPAPEQRCPSKWGAQDERGAANHMTPQNVMRASRLIRTGQVFELGRVLESGMPLFGTRKFEIHTKRTGPVLGENKRRSNEELVVTEIGQVGTQFDMFSHQTIGDQFYNCIDNDEIATRNGFTRLGVEKIGTLYTRGVLIDVAAYKGVERLPSGYEISVSDLQGALQKQGMRLEPGDAALIHSGYGSLWGVDNATYNRDTPGIGAPAAEWLAGQDVMLIGADTFGVEVAPNPDGKLSLPVHQIALVVNGIFLLENMRLDELAAAKAYEFAFIVQPLKVKGGTGSTVAPVAIR